MIEVCNKIMTYYTASLRHGLLRPYFFKDGRSLFQIKDRGRIDVLEHLKTSAVPLRYLIHFVSTYLPHEINHSIVYTLMPICKGSTISSYNIYRIMFNLFRIF